MICSGETIFWLFYFVYPLVLTCIYRVFIRLADKSWQKVLLADLLWGKNTAEYLADSADKLKRPPGAANEVGAMLVVELPPHPGCGLLKPTRYRLSTCIASLRELVGLRKTTWNESLGIVWSCFAVLCGWSRHSCRSARWRNPWTLVLPDYGLWVLLDCVLSVI